MMARGFQRTAVWRPRNENILDIDGAVLKAASTYQLST